jgi:phenylacetate-CoA ligase
MPTYHGQLGPEPRDPGRTFWDPDAQTMPRDQLRALQLERLRTMVGRIIDTPVPLFKRKLDEAGITSPADLTDLDDINTIPTTVKQDLRDQRPSRPSATTASPRAIPGCGSASPPHRTPTAVFTQHDIGSSTSRRRAWWRPWPDCHHAHPAYLYGGA